MSPGFYKRGTSKGFTLVEVLVALAITGMLVSVLMSILFYLFKVQESVRGELVTRELHLRTQDWLREVVSGCLPDARQSPRAFKGDQRTVLCETTGPISPTPLPTTAVATLFLEAKDGVTTLNYRDTSFPSSKSVPLLIWNDSDISFLYLDSGNNTHDSWPFESKDYEALPRQVWLVQGAKDAHKILWMAALRADPWLPEKQKLPMGMSFEVFK